MKTEGSAEKFSFYINPMKYAVLYAEVADRRDEITNEEFWLYFLIVLSSFVIKEGVNAGMRVCEINDNNGMHKFCRMHNLDYHNTQRRTMRLRTGTFARKEPVKKVAKMETPWIYKTNSGDFLPLVGIKESEIVKNTIFMNSEIVKNTNSNCKKYKKSAEKIVKNTTPFKKDLNNSLNNFLNKPAAEENPAAAAAEKNGLSKFSEKDCLRYAQLRKQKGDPIRNVIAFKNYLFSTGDQDDSIQAELYPEKPAPIPIDERLADGLKILLEVQAEGDDVTDWKKWYSEEDWQWLMTELANVRLTKV